MGDPFSDYNLMNENLDKINRGDVLAVRVSAEHYLWLVSARSNARSDLEYRILEYANDLRRNSSGGDDYPWEYAKGTADYLETLIARSRSAGPVDTGEKKDVENG
jgi:hypothetical protein